MPKSSPFAKLETQVRAIGAGYRRELVGGIVAAIGIFLLIDTLRYNPATQTAPPLLVVLAGWTAVWVAVTILIFGLVLLLGRRAGYWSAEALVGAELLLLGLQVATHLIAVPEVNWNMRLDGANGGLIGWALGTLLASVLGRWLALLLAFAAVVGGLAMLVRYTPLIYLAVMAARSIPGLSRWANSRPEAVGRTPLPRTANFVSADSPAGSPTGSLTGAPNDPQRTPAAAVFVSPTAPRPAPAQPKPAAAASAAAKPAATQPAPKPEPGKAPAKPAPAKSAAAPRPATHAQVPSPDLLNADSGAYTNSNVALLEQIILNTLDDFDVPVRVVHVESGPTVTQFGVEPLYVERAGQKRKVRVNRIVGLANDLALALAAPAVRIEAPVPGRPYVGIEVPNPDKSLVSLRGIMESPDLRKGGALVLPLGRNTAGHPVVMDLTKAPHMLIAGATGSGKSVCINTIITGLLMQHGPEMLRMILVDPKMVELPSYNGIPHLYGKVITDVEQVMGALTWLLLQMDDRYQLFRDLGVRNIETYNATVRKQKGVEPLPYIVLVIDELADLMMTAADDVERQICRLAQMARATGIHLVLATQRPSTDVITGLIKANFPTRISFAVTSQIDSRVILDTPGAETLLGRGDMLLMRPDVGKLTRLQGCYVADDEIGRVVGFWKQQADRGSAESQPAKPPPWNSIMDQLGDDEELIRDAVVVLRGMRTCSTSLLQRRLGLGYPKAARLMETLEQRNIVGPDLGGGRGREVLLKQQDEDTEDDLFETGEDL